MRVLRTVDLSVSVGPGTVVYPGDPAPRFSPHSTIDAQGFNLLNVTMGSQSGTHVDAPYHFEQEAPRVDELDVSLFVGPGVVIDATGLPARGVITADHVLPVLDKIGPGTIVLLRTDWSRHYGTPTYFENPYLDPEACRIMLEAGARSFCLDAINIDETPDEEHLGNGFPVHHLIARAGGIIGENFCNLDQVTWEDPFISCPPIRFEGADGAPVRAVALELSA